MTGNVRPGEIGKYEVLRELGRGSMGVVYEARQKDLDRRVALKVLAPIIANDELAVARFEREAQAAARLDHRNIAAVHEFGRDGEYRFYSMELVEGQSLQRRLAEEPESEAERLRWIARTFADVARGLHAAHDAGVIHRDVKPSNILLAADGTPKLVDFGLARLGGTAESLTSPGSILGTLCYMSPEQAMAGDLDARTDVYSLGASLYEALTKQPPFDGDDPVSLIGRIVYEPPPAPRGLRPGIPRDLETITLKAMSKDRRLRYRTALELAEDLERFLREETILAKRPGLALRVAAWLTRSRGRVAGSMAAAALVALALLALWPGETELPEPAMGMSLAEFAPGTASAGGKIDGWEDFLVPGRGKGTAVCVALRRGGKTWPELYAFGPDRKLLWKASEKWADFEETFGWGAGRLMPFACLITRGVAPVPEESLMVSGYHHGLTNILIVDPRTGVRHGTWAPPPEFVLRDQDRETISVVPDWSERSRLIMIAGRVEERPALAILARDGTLVRRYGFPVVGVTPGVEVGIAEVKCDWSREWPSVTVLTDEWLFFEMPVKEGELDRSRVRVSVGDPVDDGYDKVHGEGAFEKLVERTGGYEAYVRALCAGVTVKGGGQ